MRNFRSASKAPFQLFKHNNSNRWSVRFSIKGQGQQRISLGTEDVEEAKRLALEEWSKSKARAEMGLSVKRKKFSAMLVRFEKGNHLGHVLNADKFWNNLCKSGSIDVQPVNSTENLAG